MRNEILNTSADMFLTLGFKSVTMDDIAKKMHVSKKTIYMFFKTKTELVKEVTMYFFEKIKKGINFIVSLEKNSIDELYEIKEFIIANLKNEKSSPQYQLQKYYPKIAAELRKKQLEVVGVCLINNLKKGVLNGIYRKEIDVYFISKIYFHGMMGIRDVELFPVDKYSIQELMELFLEYHLRGICTDKGLKILSEIKNK